RTPSVCATRLRYVPMSPTLGFPLEQSQDVAQFLAHLSEHLISVFFLRSPRFGQHLSGAGNGESPLVKQFLYSKKVFDILPFIYVMGGLGALRDEVREFGFPETKNIRFDAHDFADLTDFEKKLIWNLLCGHELQPSLYVA